jgi:NAD+ kinase
MTRVGLLGDGAGAAADVVCEGGGDPVVGEDALAGDVDALAALGEPALLDALAADVDAPVLPAAAGREYGGVSRDDLPDALAALTAGEYDVRERQTLSVTTDGVDTRADGVVAATPAGSHGYARDADGPLLSRGAGALSVVPVAQFRPERSRWVLDPPVTLTVVRDDADVSLLVDGRDNGFADAHQSVTLDWGDPLPVAVVASSTPVATFE